MTIINAITGVSTAGMAQNPRTSAAAAQHPAAAAARKRHAATTIVASVKGST